MAFFRWRTIKGRQYLYEETRFREGGKVRSRSRIVGSHAVDERYREVLRQNVYLYGKGRPGERYLREAQAREQYQREMLALNRREKGANKIETPFAFEARLRMYDVSHGSAAARARGEYLDLKDTLRAEDARLEDLSVEEHSH